LASQDAITTDESSSYLSVMAMTWDAVLVSALAEELDALLRGGRLRAHSFRWEARELTLVFREGVLRWHLHPRMGWLTFSPHAEAPANARPLAARVSGVRALPDERILEVLLRRERGKRRTFRLVVELMTNQWNALLLEGEEGWVRHLLWTRRSEDRTLAIGQRYSPPPPSRRRGIEAPLSPEEWSALVAGKAPEAARAALLGEVAFTSPINVSSLLALIPAEGRKRWIVLREVEKRQPCLLEINRDKQPYPYILEGFAYTNFPNLITAIQAAAGVARGALDPGEKVLEHLERTLDRARRRARGIRREMTDSADPEEARGQANLLLAHLRDVPRGADTANLPGFDGEEVSIRLDPALSPQENARLLYDEAARRERARDRLPPLLEGAEAEIRALEELREKLSEGSLTPPEAAARLPGPKDVPSRERKDGARVPFRRYSSSGGLEIRVGRSARDNDLLTFRHSHPDDVWLHARQQAGAHVILQWRKEGSPPRRDLTEAAVLAALHSGARTSATVPVDWTRRKYVRKPRGSAPGTVVLQQSHTLFVEPDPGLPGRLRRPRKGKEDPGLAS
jgi:predicted ribosome quality control (RQC) complex YloA/Tae2 family protein